MAHESACASLRIRRGTDVNYLRAIDLLDEISTSSDVENAIERAQIACHERCFVATEANSIITKMYQVAAAMNGRWTRVEKKQFALNQRMFILGSVPRTMSAIRWIMSAASDKEVTAMQIKESIARVKAYRGA